MDPPKQPHTVPDPGRRLCRVEEARAQLAMSRSKLYELMDSGRIEYVRIGRSRRILVSSLSELIESSRVER